MECTAGCRKESLVLEYGFPHNLNFLLDTLNRWQLFYFILDYFKIDQQSGEIRNLYVSCYSCDDDSLDVCIRIFGCQQIFIQFSLFLLTPFMLKDYWAYIRVDTLRFKVELLESGRWPRPPNLFESERWGATLYP